MRAIQAKAFVILDGTLLAIDLTAARRHGIIEALADAGLNCWSDKAYQGCRARPSGSR